MAFNPAFAQAPAGAAPAGAGAGAQGAPATPNGAPTNSNGSKLPKARIRGATGSTPAGASPGGVTHSPMTPIAPSVKGGAVIRGTTDIRTGQPSAAQGPAQSFNIQPAPGGNAGPLSPRKFNVQGYGGNINPGNPLILSDVPSIKTMQQPAMQPYFGPSFAAPPMSAASMIGSCLQSMSGQIGGLAQMAALQTIVDEADEKVGFQPYPGVSSRANPNYYASIVNGLTGQQAGCQQFINNKMEIGHWGRVALEEMKNHQDVYKDKIPEDIGKYCANFRTMEEDTRIRFWIWFFGSLSAPESSCNPGVIGRGPNGNAIGLFQLEPRACARVNMFVTESDLQRAEVNIRCAVRLFAEELRKRPTIMIGTSRGELGTYWGPLRNDNDNLARGGDISAHFKAEARLRQNPECVNGRSDAVAFNFKH